MNLFFLRLLKRAKKNVMRYYIGTCLICNTIYGPVYNAHYLLIHLYTSVSGWLSDWLRIGRCGNRIPIGARFSTPVQTGPGAHSACYKMGTVSIPEVKRPGRGVDHPTSYNSEMKVGVELYRYAPRNDVSVNDGPHIRRWSHKIIIQYYNTYRCVTIAYSIQYSNMLYRFVA